MSDWWKNYPWRLIQTNLREIDMRDIKASQVVKDLQSFKATVLMINAAGIIASYPTKIPYHFQSPFLTGDSLMDILAACHDAGLRVIARTDFSKVRRPVFEQHPEWAYVSAKGENVDYNGDIHVCVNSWYQQEGILHILDELFTSHPFDGVFFNMGGYITHDYSGNYHGPCRCLNCQARYIELFNENLLPSVGSNDSSSSLYDAFKQRTLQDQKESIYRFLSERFPNLCIANHQGFRRGFIRQESNTAVDRPLPVWQFSGSANTKWAVGSYPEMVSSNTSVDFIDFPYRHAAVSPHEQSLRLVQSLANGGAIDFYLIGRLDNHEDRSGYLPVRQIFNYHANHERHYQELNSMAEIALFRPESEDRAEYRGWFRVLTENHFPFDVLTIQAALQRPWRRYRTIILPNTPALSDAFVQEIDKFVSTGGTLIASGLSGTRTENGAPRSGFGMMSLGAEEPFLVRDSVRSAYFKLLDKEKFPRLETTDLVYIDGNYIYTQLKPDSQPFLKLIPPHNFGPPERCYYEQITDHPGLIQFHYGRGQSIYLPWLAGSQFYRHGQLNTAWLLADILEHLANLQPIRSNLPPQVEVSLHRNLHGAVMVQMVNASGHFGNSFHPPVSITGVEVKVPWNSSLPLSVQALYSGQQVGVESSEDELTLTLPRLGLFEAVVITPSQTN